MLETDATEAARVAADLDRLNDERRAIEVATVEEAVAQMLVREASGTLPAVLVAGGADWHPGVVGLVAARLKERFSRPVFAIAWNGETGTGSGRSIPGVDLGAAVRAAVETGHLVKGGGHAMAAGITVAREAQAAFERFLEMRLADSVARARADDALQIDAALSAGGATLEFLAQVSCAGPFGAGHAEPVFVLPSHRVTGVLRVGDSHLRLGVESRDGAKLDVMAFRAANTELGSALEDLRGRGRASGGDVVGRSLGRPAKSLRAPCGCRPRRVKSGGRLATSGSDLYRPQQSRSRAKSAHRLAVQDVALSRRKQGFDSPWAHQQNQ